MGANSSSLSELSSNEYLNQLSGTNIITSNDPFWNQLLSFQFQIPRTIADQRLLEESTTTVCKTFAINNCRTGNFGALIEVFLARATELKASSQVEDNIFTWQTYNALFIIRNLCMYFVENLSEEVIVQQFETKPPSTEGAAKPGQGTPKAEELINCLIELLVDMPTLAHTYALHLECVNTLLILLSVQMFQPGPASQTHIYTYLMHGKSAIHACVLVKKLLQNFAKQEKCPADLLPENAHGKLHGITTAVASGLWSMLTLGMASKVNKPEEVISETLLANQSLLLILVLANHCTAEAGLHNPFRQALLSFTNCQEDGSDTSSPTQSLAMFRMDVNSVYNALCITLQQDQSTLLLYLLLHRNSAMKAYILSRTNIDQLVIPLLRLLYHAQERNSHHIYMGLIILLILSEDDCFSKAVHEIVLKNITWFQERHLKEITLGGLLILVVIRTIQYNMTRMRDKYLHTNCLAALANMSAHFQGLHPYVSQRIVSLFAMLLKKHTRIVDRIREAAVENHNATDTGSETEPDQEIDYVQELAAMEEVIRMVLEIINSCLTHSLHHNPNLVYTLLYQRELFAHFRTHPTFQDIIQNIDTVLSYFTSKLEQQQKNLSVPEVQEIVRQGVLQFRRDRLKKFPELKFKYVEEESPEEFFIPYVWSLVYHSSTLYFNPSRIQLFSLQGVS